MGLVRGIDSLLAYEWKQAANESSYEWKQTGVVFRGGMQVGQRGPNCRSACKMFLTAVLSRLLASCFTEAVCCACEAASRSGVARESKPDDRVDACAKWQGVVVGIGPHPSLELD